MSIRIDRVNSGNAAASGTSSLKLGRNSEGGYFSGLIDELRVSVTVPKLHRRVTRDFRFLG